MTLDGFDPAFASVRLGVAFVFWAHWFPEDLTFPRQPHPIGVARFVDLSVLGRPPVRRAVERGIRAILVLYVLGWFPLATAVVLAAFAVAVGTLWCSQGAIGHAFQAQALVCVAQAAAHLVSSVAGSDARTAEATAVDYTRQVLVAVYFTAGLTKLSRSHGAWVWKAPSLAVQVAKTAEFRFQETLADEPRRRRREVAAALVRRPWTLRAGAGAALALELSSPILLLDPLVGFAGGALLVAFHRANHWVLGHSFAQMQALMLVTFVNPLLLV